MNDQISVCHVVNTLGDTSMPGDIATTQASLKEFDRVGVLAWFDVDSFQNSDRIDTVSVDISNTVLLNRSQYLTAKSVLSQYDIVHTHHPHSGFYAKLIAKRLGKPIVHTEHNNHDGFTRKGRIANGTTNSIVDAVICVSDSVEDSFFPWEHIFVSGSKVSIINNGVDLDRIEAAKNVDWSIDDTVDLDPESFVVGSAGMLTEQKAHEVLIKAVDQANIENKRSIELVISGDGELRDQLESQIDQAEYSDRLHLLGFLEDRKQVYKMMEEIDIYAMPSRWEGFCVAALEALALENACVFSDIPEFKKPFGQVAQFHSLDDSGDLAEKILHLAADDELRRELGKAARQLVVKEYTLEQTAKEYLQKYVEFM
jgi:glycosyltransferase involved in cell wall biosynthesis